ncbi:EamA family transporter [Leucobacter sp. BZR 635]
MAGSQHISRGNAVRATILVAAGSIAVQFSAVLAYGLFDTVGPAATGTLRLLVAAVVLLAVVRPGLRGRTRQEWTAILSYGFSMAAIIICLYLAIARIPLGIAMTINFLGACAVALIGARRVRDALLAVVALLGVALIAGLGGPLDPIGMLFAACSAAGVAAYTLFAARVGQAGGGLSGVTIAITVAAILTLPISLPGIPLIQPHQWLPLVLSGLCTPALSFIADTIAGRLTSARVIGVLFAFDPVMGAIFGALFLGQTLAAPSIVGITLIVAAGTCIIWFAGKPQGFEIPPLPEG